MEFTEEDIINGFINNNDIGDVKKILDKDLTDFFFGKADIPEKYKNIKKDLFFIRSLYKNSIKIYSRFYFFYIVAVFTCIYNEGFKIPNKFYTYLKQNRYQFAIIQELMDYFVIMFLPQRDDLMKYNTLLYKQFSIGRFYGRVGNHILFTHRGNFLNYKEKELFNILDDYNNHGIYALKTLLIGFYYINHDKYNLSIEQLKEALNNYHFIIDKMLLNGLNYDYLNDELILGLFENNKNKMIIK